LLLMILYDNHTILNMMHKYIYLVLLFFIINETYGIPPHSNTKHILLKDNFERKSKWFFKRGDWEIENNNMIQKNTGFWNTNSYRRLVQEGTLFYEWDVIMHKGILDSGLHIFASDGSLMGRGTSYLIWQFKDGFVIYKTINNKLKEKIRFRSSSIINTRYRCKVEYNPEKGIVTIWRAEYKTQNNKSLFHNYVQIGEWTDKKPIIRGDYISFRTNKTSASFSKLLLYRIKGK